jgi:hypothetical protein
MLAFPCHSKHKSPSRAAARERGRETAWPLWSKVPLARLYWAKVPMAQHRYVPGFPWHPPRATLCSAEELAGCLL